MIFYIKRKSSTDTINSYNALTAFLKSLSNYSENENAETFDIISISDEKGTYYTIENFLTLLEILLLKP